MKLKVHVNLGNEAMRFGEHLAWALSPVLAKIKDIDDPKETDIYDRSGSIRDEDGNTVGRWEIS